MLSESGRIIAANNLAHQFLKHPPGTLTKHGIEDLVPERFRSQHEGKRAAFVAGGKSRPMGASSYFPALCGDGTEITVDIGIGRIAHPAYLVVTLVDRTHKAHQEEELVNLANRDSLTGLNTRRFYLESAANVVSHALRTNEPMSIIYFDIDYFKNINDTYGHAIGDLVLQQIGIICRQIFRQHDVVGRIGGEEFSAVLSATNLSGAEALAERLRLLFSQIRVDAGNKGTVSLTASFGIAELKPPQETLEELSSRADNALYEAKHGGRNRVMASNNGHHRQFREVVEGGGG